MTTTLVERLRAHHDTGFDLYGMDIPVLLEAASLIERQEALVAKLSKALATSMTALDDWINVHASDECAPDRVEEAKYRIGAVGTLAYIAEVQSGNRAALAEAKTHAGE